jgi:hypothetical protein
MLTMTHSERTAPLQQFLLLAFLLVHTPVIAQTATNSPPPTNTVPAGVENPPERDWTFSATISGYLVPEGRDYVQPTLTAEYAGLHLEARYNYEALDTASLWVGYKFAGGKDLAWEITPMLGGVFGEVNGIAPGYKGSLRWWKLEFYSEGEYVASTDDSSESFFYNWSELTLAPVDWFRFGLLTQRTRAYHTDRDIQRGFIVGFSLERVDFTTYVLNPDESKPTVILALGMHF